MIDAAETAPRTMTHVANLPPAIGLDVAIVNFHSCNDTLAAIESVGIGSHGTIWVIDNSEDAAQAEALRQALAARNDVKVVIAESNLGFGRACNRIFLTTTAPFLLLLNPDARIGADDVRRLLVTMQGNPMIGAVSPRIYWDPNRAFLLPAAFPQSPLASLALAAGSRIPSLARQIATHRLYRMHRLMTRPQPFAVDFLAGAVMMIRRDAVNAVGGLFDDEYFMFFEDADLSVRLRRGGYGLRIVPGSSAEHTYRHKAFKASLMDMSRSIFFRKRFPLFYRLSDELRLVDRIQRQVRAPQGAVALARTAAEFNDVTRGATLLGFSPSPLAMPAAFRSVNQEAVPMDAATWQLLEDGTYHFFVAPAGDISRAHWIEVSVSKVNA